MASARLGQGLTQIADQILELLLRHRLTMALFLDDGLNMFKAGGWRLTDAAIAFAQPEIRPATTHRFSWTYPKTRATEQGKSRRVRFSSGGMMRRREFLWCGAAVLSTRARGQEAASAVTHYENASGGHIGFYAENTRTGQSMSWRADDRFVMCSTFKASLAGLILHRVDHRQDDLESRISFGPADMQDWYAPVAQANLQKGSLTVGEMCAAAVEQSDNTCASLLLSRVGGPSQITAFWRSLGDTTSRLDDPEPYLNRTPLGGVKDTTTPRAMAGTLKQLVLGDALSSASRRVLAGWLESNKTGDDRLRSGLPKAWTTGDKTGNNGKDAAGDIAATWTSLHAPIIIAAYTRGGVPTEAQFKEAFHAIGLMVAAGLG